MKRITTLQLLGVMLMALGTALPASALKFMEDSICYTTIWDKPGELAVISMGNYDSQLEYTYYHGDLVIPASVTHDSVTYSVTRINYDAFEDCYNLTSVTIPATVNDIMGQGTFYGTDQLRGFYVDEDNAWYCDIDGVLLSKDKTVLYIFPNAYASSTYEVPDGVTTIDDGAFNKCKGITTVTFPSSLTSIGYSAFSYCDGLVEITVPPSVTSIERYAFSHCTHIQRADLQCRVIGQEMLSGCSALAEVTLGDGVASIGANAFNRCTSLKSINVPASVTSIGWGVFNSCDSLSTATIDCPTVGHGMFYSFNKTLDE